MNLIFDLILCAVMALIVYVSYKKGFVSSLLSLASIVVSSLCAWIFHPQLADFISQSFVKAPLVRSISEKISSFAENGNLDSMIKNMPVGLKDFLNSVGVDHIEVTEKYAEADLSASAYVQELAGDVADIISYVLSTGIAILAIFIVATIICTLVSCFINSIFKLPVLKQANELLGLCLGIVCALLFAWLFSNCSVKIMDGLSLIYSDSFSAEALKSSVIINFFYNFNPYTLFSN